MGRRRRPFPSLLALVLSATTLLPLVASARQPDWLDIRRRGIGGMLQVATESAAAVPRLAVYRSTAAKGDPLHGLEIHLRWKPLPVKDKTRIVVGSDLVVIVRDGAGKFVAGLAREGDKLYTRHGSGKAVADDKALFRPIAGLGVPLALFAVLELAKRYDVKLEGEFEGTAILRMSPGYTEGPALEPLKLGLSKRTLQTTVTEVDGAQGKMRHRLLWLDLEQKGERAVARQLRLRTETRTDALDFRIAADVVGGDLKKHKEFRKWGRAALSGR